MGNPAECCCSPGFGNDGCSGFFTVTKTYIVKKEIKSQFKTTKSKYLFAFGSFLGVASQSHGKAPHQSVCEHAVDNDSLTKIYVDTDGTRTV